MCPASGAPQETAPGDREISLVDNGSKERSAATAGALCRNSTVPARYLRSETNRGFAAGCNHGMNEASGRYCLLLNQDVKLAPDYVSRLRLILDEQPSVGAVQGRIMQAGAETIDSMGQSLDLFGRCQ